MKLDIHSPVRPTKYENRDVMAIQSLVRGEATPEQQKQALDFIILKMCATYDEPYRPDQRETDYALGKAHVGRELVKLTKLKIGALK
jgi:hypothetical protein